VADRSSATLVFVSAATLWLNANAANSEADLPSLALSAVNAANRLLTSDATNCARSDGTAYTSFSQHCVVLPTTRFYLLFPPFYIDCSCFFRCLGLNNFIDYYCWFDLSTTTRTFAAAASAFCFSAWACSSNFLRSSAAFFSYLSK
jgi:hypothetical protein